MLSNSSLLLTSIVEILSYALLADQVSRQCAVRLYVQLEYFLSFDCQVKYVLVNKGNKSLNLLHIFLTVAKILSTTHCLATIGCNKRTRIKSSSNKTEFNTPSSINQMVIQLGGKYHRVAV